MSDDTQPIERPTYGLGHLAPEDAIAIWGARAIFTGGHVDLVPGRLGATGSPEARERLGDILSGSDDRGIAALRQAIRGEYLDGRLDGNMAAVVTIYEDDEFAFVVSPNASYGYLYMAAWLKPPKSDG